MFDLKPETLKFFKAHIVERAESGYPVTQMGLAEFQAIEALWGYALPDAYKAFQMEFGDTAFPDEGQSRTTYIYKENGFEQGFECVFGGFSNVSTLQTGHQHLIADPDNETETPFFPPHMLPFGSDPGTNLFLLELGTETPAIWFWEDQYDAWGEGDNTRLGYIAPDLSTFIKRLS